MCNVESVEKIAGYLGVTPGKLSCNREQVVTRTLKGRTLQGFGTIITQLLRECRPGSSKVEALEKECEIKQWIDFAVAYIGHGANDKQIVRTLLNNLNNHLLTRSYLVGYSITLADLVVFYVIRDSMIALSLNERENFLNLSRWFDHLQRNDHIQQGADVLNFTTIHLHGWATGTHL